MSKHDDRKKLEGKLLQFKSPVDLRPQRPPQDPIEAQLEELARIVKKAMAGLREQGVNDLGEPMPRGFVGYVREVEQ